MKSGNEHDRCLGKRDQSILADVFRYRLTTNGMVRNRHLPGASANAVSKVTARLVREKWLQSHSLFERQVYFTPGKTCLRQYGLPASRMLPLGTQALATHLSIASYCLKQASNCQLLSRSDFADSWTWIPKRFRHLPHVMYRSEQKFQLRMLRVDLGGTPEHVATKCHQDICARNDIPGYRELFASRSLLFVVLTTTESKKQSIMSALQRRIWPANTRFEVVVIPDLSRLLSI